MQDLCAAENRYFVRDVLDAVLVRLPRLKQTVFCARDPVTKQATQVQSMQYRAGRRIGIVSTCGRLFFT